VTTVEDQVPPIEALLEKYGVDGRGRVRACRVGVADASARTEQAERLLDMQIRAAMEEDGALAIVLGSGAYAGRADDLRARHGIDVIEGLTAAIRHLASAT